MATLLRDLRYATRVLGRGPGFAITAAVHILAPPMGSDTAIFSVIEFDQAINTQRTAPARVAGPPRSGGRSWRTKFLYFLLSPGYRRGERVGRTHHGDERWDAQDPAACIP